MVAHTILEQIKALDNMALWAWGANQFVAMENGVQFKIRTPKYKRGVMVRITLNWMDTYDIKVIRVTKGKEKVLETAEDIYCDMLVDVLDRLIEGDKKEVIFF